MESKTVYFGDHPVRFFVARRDAIGVANKLTKQHDVQHREVRTAEGYFVSSVGETPRYYGLDSTGLAVKEIPAEVYALMYAPVRTP